MTATEIRTMLKHIPLENVNPNPGQPRKTFPEASLRELGASIKENGLLQPVTVRPKGDGKFEIVSGERRWRAHQLINAETVHCRVVKMDDDKMAVNALIENLQREDVRPVEEAHAIHAMMERGYSEQDLSKMLGISVFRVRQKAS